MRGAFYHLDVYQGPKRRFALFWAKDRRDALKQARVLAPRIPASRVAKCSEGYVFLRDCECK